jgi:23S rRNA pseudouridine1911/1915/1917 synthase
MNTEIIFENDAYLVINKPPGLVVHSDGKTDERTLVDWVIENYPEIENVGEPLIIRGKDDEETILKRPGIVHRLDRETSGVMIIVKTDEAFQFFKSAFKDRDISKTYNAIVWGHVKEDDGVIDAPIARSKSDFRKWSAQRGARGQKRNAVTEYEVLSRFTDDGQKFTLLELKPQTGRTHQIRVHMKYFNHPIICDSLYGEGKPPVLGFARTALHSRKIEFTDMEGENQAFEAPYPDDFLETIAKL